MKNKKPLKVYDPLEEKWNVYTHAFGLLLSVAGFFLLVSKAVTDDGMLRIVSFSIFGASLIILYLASTLFHNSKDIEKRKQLNVFDHASIFILIAGSYTPFTLVTLNGNLGWIVFTIVWSIALIGVILKLFFTGRFKKISTIAYVLMGWIVLFVVKPIINNISIDGFYWLLAGGLFYTVGALLYSFNKIKYNHVIFHLFVLAGSFCHFITVYYYV